MYNSNLADISAFLSIQNAKTHSSVSVFNTDVDDIKTSVQEWMDQIDALRELQADAEAEAEESKLEGVLAKFDERIKSSIRSARTTITELKRSGAADDSESEGAAAEESGQFSEPEEDFGDFDSLMSEPKDSGKQEAETEEEK